MNPTQYDRGVFLNCPFDRHYEPVFRAIVFCVSSAGLVPRCAWEVDNGAQNRLDKIFRMIGECRYGIHDISRTELDITYVLPRFNMPLELGMFLGCARFGGRAHAGKACLILDRERYRYQKFLSDLAGQDVHAHHGDPRTAVAEVRSWLRSAAGRQEMAGGEEIWRRYLLFQRDLPEICKGMKLRPNELTFRDLVTAIRSWL